MATGFVFKPTVIQPTVELPVKQEKVIFNAGDYPLVDKDALDIARENYAKSHPHTVSKKSALKLTQYVIGKVRIIYDGENYEAQLLRHMAGKGFEYWKHLYEKEIAFARAMCYAQHVIKYGNYGQTIPPKASEYLTKPESEKLKIEAEINLKNEINFDAELQRIHAESFKSEKQLENEKQQQENKEG